MAVRWRAGKLSWYDVKEETLAHRAQQKKDINFLLFADRLLVFFSAG